MDLETFIEAVCFKPELLIMRVTTLPLTSIGKMECGSKFIVPNIALTPIHFRFSQTHLLSRW